MCSGMGSNNKTGDRPRYKCGLLFRWGSCWVGGHYSPHNKRLCINLIPFVTFWIVWPGGNTP